MATLVVATIALSTIGGPGTAAAPDPEVQPAHTASTDASTEASAILESAEAALEGDDPDLVESPTLALTELSSVYDDLSPREQRTADALLARPDGTGNPDLDPVIWTVPEEPRKCGDHVCVHYVGSTSDRSTDEWAATTLSVLESVWTHDVSHAGFRAPASDSMDGDELGGDSKFDVYLVELEETPYYGYCAPDAHGQPRSSGYCVLDNDNTQFVGSPLANLKVTASHEFFHVIQYNYDANEDRWLMEATATWMEEDYADSVNDNRQYLSFGQLGRPSTPLDAYTGLTPYGNWLFFEKLTKKYGAGAIRSIWNRLDTSAGAPDQYSIQAVSNTLKAHGTTLRKFYAHYAAGNLSPSRTYAEGSAYDATNVARKFTFKPGRKSVAPRGTKLRHLTSRSYQFKPGASLPGKSKLKIIIDAPAKGTSPAAVAYVYAKSGKLTKKFIRLSKSGAGSTRVKFAPRKIKRVTLTLVNASTRFGCWEGTNYSCQGFPLDNSSKFTFRAKVVR
jgi:hypothetical protein